MAAPASVIDVTDATFERDVIEASRSQPVVVDFWATWCPPCRMLGPILEDVAATSSGVTLVKLDTDASPRAAMRFAIRSIPAVKAFRGGEVIGEFIGLQSRPFVERFFAQLAPAVVEALPADEAGLRSHLENHADDVGARNALGRLLIDEGRLDDADAVLGLAALDPVVDGLRARIAILKRTAASLPDALAHPDGPGELQAVPAVLDAIRSATGDDRTLLRRVAVGVLAENASDPVTSSLRQQLASVLF